jgi:lactoylglutathione lyase
MREEPLTTNLILYCAEWEATVRFYRDALGLPVTTETDWFVEFGLGRDSRLSIADERRASIKGCGGAGITVSLRVPDVDAAWAEARVGGLEPTDIVDHPWDARVFYLFDPEGHRLEMWQQTCPR